MVKLPLPLIRLRTTVNGSPRFHGVRVSEEGKINQVPGTGDLGIIDLIRMTGADPLLVAHELLRAASLNSLSVLRNLLNEATKPTVIIDNTSIAADISSGFLIAKGIISGLVISENGQPYFIARTVPKELGPEIEFPQAPGHREVVAYPCEFGLGQTIYSPDRAKKPTKPKVHGTIELKDAMKILDTFQGPGNIPIRMRVAELTLDPEVIRRIIHDPLEHPDVKYLAALNVRAPLDARRQVCAFCEIAKWAGPRLTYEDLVVGAANNPFPFARPEHDVDITFESIHNFGELELKHIVDFIRLASRRAKSLAQDESYKNTIDGVVFGMNFGTGRMEDGWETNSSFASLQHVHVQMLTQLKDTYNPGDEIADFIESWPYETPFLEAYLQALENNQLVIKKYGAGDNICAWLIVPRSQKAMHHIRIITNPKAGNFRETDEAIDMALGEAIFDGTMALRSLGVKTFNIISFCKRFSDERQGVPMVVDILPRGGIAFAELSGKGLWVVDGSSEETVRKIRGSTTSNNQSDRCLSRARLVQITLSELQSSANPLGDDPLATHILGGNNNIAVRHFVAATLPAREKLSIYGRDMQLLRELPEGIIIQLGVSRENIIRPRQDSFEEIRQVINLASADKRHCQLLLEVLRIFAQRCHEDKSFLARLHDKFNTEMSARREKRIILDDLINIPNIPWQNLCNLSAEDLTEAIYQRMDEICHK